MSALEDLQSSAHTRSADLDESLAAAAELEQQTEDLAQRLAALGNEASSRLLTASAGPRLATVREQLTRAQRELDAFVQACEQAKGTGMSGSLHHPGGSPSSTAASSRSSPRAAGLANAEHAVVDERKFTAYSMDPAADNGGKSKAWQALGYDLGGGRAEAAADVMRQLRQQLPDVEPYEEKMVRYGRRCRTDATITGPSGRSGTLVCVWQVDRGSTKPRMITHWLEVHTEEGPR